MSSWSLRPGAPERRTRLGLVLLRRRPLEGVANATSLAEPHSAIQQAADEAGTSVYRITLAWNSPHARRHPDPRGPRASHASATPQPRPISSSQLTSSHYLRLKHSRHSERVT
nr:hypothetical protein [Streptomyces sp.]